MPYLGLQGSQLHLPYPGDLKRDRATMCIDIDIAPGAASSSSFWGTVACSASAKFDTQSGGDHAMRAATFGKQIASSSSDHTTRVQSLETVPDVTRQIHNKTLVASEGYSLVFRADWKRPQGSPIKVAMKIPRISRLDNGRDKTLKRLKREARVWRSLNHPNIVPLLGLVSGKLGPGLVTPWYAHGTVLQYIRRVPNVQRESLCEDVARGLRYLHEQDPPIIHGDLKGANVLVAIDGRAAVCDFGLSIILDSGPTGFASFVPASTLRFKAPEEFAHDLEGGSIPRDIYSYACTYAQIMTGDPPFHWHRTDPLIMRAICGGELPYRIDSIISRHDLGFLEPSWDANPTHRPTMSNICDALGISEDSPSASRPVHL